MADQEGNISDLRNIKRRHLIYYLEVYDDSTGKLLGHLVDLTVKGIKLVSREEIAIGNEFALKMILPLEYSSKREVKFKAKSQWSSPDVNPDFYATGFSAPELDQETRSLFIALINLVGFND